jgi:hypothetical protein
MIFLISIFNVRRLSLIIILRSINFIFPLIIVNVVRVKGTFILLRVFIYLVFLIDVEIKLVEFVASIWLLLPSFFCLNFEHENGCSFYKEMKIILVIVII